MVFTVAFGIFASIKYGANAQQIEGISHRDINQTWTIVLLWIPLILQLIILALLTRRVWRHKSDLTIRHYFKFYFIRTSVSAFIYVTLWLLYVSFVGAETSGSLLSTLRLPTLAAIGLLMYFVVQATYLITRSSLRSSNRLFRVHELSGNYQCICKTLREVSPAVLKQRTNEAGNGDAHVDAGLNKIHEWLLKDRDYKVHRVAYKGTIADLDLSHLVEALNRLICSRQFYNSHTNSNDGDDLPPSEFESKNRIFIEKHLLRRCETAETESRETIAGFWSRVASVFSGERRSDKQIGQRDGIALFPFYTMVFFFSLFLCVAYLFGFAFAFEDKRAQIDSSQRSLALFMNDDLLEDVNRYQPLPSPSPSPVAYQLNERQKFFYFKPGGAGITITTNHKDDALKRISQINDNSLKSVVELIKQSLSNGPVRVLLIGRADDSSVDKITYASNYEIAAARINSVRYLLQEKLIEEQVTPRQMDAIDWRESPFSNDESLTPKEKQPGERSKFTQVLDNDISTQDIREEKVPQELVSRIDEDLNFKHGDKGWSGEFRELLGRLKTEVSKNKVTLQQMRNIYGDIERWTNHKIGGNAAEAERLRDDIDADLYYIEDLSGRKRAVEVYVYDVQPAAQTEARQVSWPTAKQMALMDYLFFAITSSNNDIKPVTPYSKFLSTLSSLTQFFFIVVFFNTLLTLKRKTSTVH
jgi:hypothetical protein